MAKDKPVAHDENRWEKDEDVRALARAHMIKKNPERHARAMKHAKTMKEEHKQRAQESQHIVNMAGKDE